MNNSIDNDHLAAPLQAESMFTFGSRNVEGRQV